MENTYLVQPCR